MKSNINNRTIFCRDNIDILQGIDSNSIDLIYLDPPFNKNKVFTAPIGSSAEGADFKDYFREEDVKDEWVQTIKEDYDSLYKYLNNIKELSSIGRTNKKNNHYLYNYCYLCYMAIRLLEMQRILKETGSIYLHCDPTMSHYLKILLDVVFGEKNFRNEIIWYYPNKQPVTSKFFIQSNDIIYFYSKTDNYRFNIQYRIGNRIFKDIERGYAKATRFQNNKKIKSLRIYNYDKLKIAIENKKIDLKDFDEQRDYSNKTGNRPIENVFNINILNSQSKERMGYPTQKPLALLERIIKASSNEGELVLDPFCGCATTCISAEKLDRQWVGIDVSVKAFDFVRKRLQKEVANPENLFQYQNKIHYSTTPPKRTDIGEDYQKKKWIYVISNKSYPNEYKVGIANDYKQRLNTYQTSDPNRNYVLEYKVQTPYFRELEKHIHEKFENRHEWVRADLKDIIKSIEDFEK